jgi:hypothetical protein
MIELPQARVRVEVRVEGLNLDPYLDLNSVEGEASTLTYGRVEFATWYKALQPRCM